MIATSLARRRLLTVGLMLVSFSAFSGPNGSNGNGQAVKALPDNILRDFLQNKLKIEDISDFDLSLKIELRLREQKLWDSLDNHGVLRRIYASFFSELSAETLARASRGFSRNEYNNVFVRGPAGVGKSYLANQFVLLYSFGIMPDYLREKLNLVNPESAAQPDAQAFLGNTNIVMINSNLLGYSVETKGAPWASEAERQKATLIGIFGAAKKEFQREGGGKRTIFYIEEAGNFPIYLHDALKTLQDEGGFDPTLGSNLRRKDPGYSVLAATTPDEYRRMIKGDSAIERRYLTIDLHEPVDSDIFKLTRDAADEWGELKGITVSDEALNYLSRMREFLNWPRLAAPASVKIATADIIQWKLHHPGDNPRHINRRDAQRFIMGRAGLTDAWFEGPNGEPPFFDLAERVKRRVVGQDEIIDDIARVMKRWARLGFGQEIPVFILAGASGAGKDTTVAAFSMELFGHESKELMFNIGGVKGFGIDAIITGPPLGNHKDDQGGLLVQGLDERSGTGFPTFNEAGDAPSEELEKLKLLIERGLIRPMGIDTRPRHLRYPIFILGQFGEHALKGLTPIEAREKISRLSIADIYQLLNEGKEGSEGRIGALSPANIDRSLKTGGVYFFGPVDPIHYPKIVETWLPKTLSNLETVAGIEATIAPELVELVGKIASNLKVGTRALYSVHSDLIVSAISEALDLGLSTPVRIHLEPRQLNGLQHIAILDRDSEKEYLISASTLLRGQNKCSEAIFAD